MVRDPDIYVAEYLTALRQSLSMGQTIVPEHIP